MLAVIGGINRNGRLQLACVLQPQTAIQPKQTMTVHAPFVGFKISVSSEMISSATFFAKGKIR